MLTKLIKWYFRALWWMILIMVPCFTLAIPVATVYDWLRPWDEAVAALEKVQPGGLRWMVGYSYERSSLNGEIQSYHQKRNFVVFPSMFRDPAVYEFSEGIGVEKGLKERPYGAFGYLVSYAAMIAFSWFVSARKFIRYIRYLFAPFPARSPAPPLVSGDGAF